MSFICSFIVLGLACGSGISLAAGGGSYALVAVHGLLITLASRVAQEGTGSVAGGPQELWLKGSRARAQ